MTKAFLLCCFTVSTWRSVCQISNVCTSQNKWLETFSHLSDPIWPGPHFSPLQQPARCSWRSWCLLQTWRSRKKHANYLWGRMSISIKTNTGEGGKRKVSNFVLDSLPPKMRDKGVKSKKYKQVHAQTYNSWTPIYTFISFIGGASVPGSGAEDLQQELQRLPHGRHPAHHGQEWAGWEEGRWCLATLNRILFSVFPRKWNKFCVR